jgi:alanyl-tRNA synthetase
MTTDARTEKLYLNDPYTTVFEARIVSCENDERGRPAAVLDRTYFYPESGGQPADRGSIAGIAVLDVQEDENGTVRHFLAAPAQTGSAECRIDWDRRFDHMQQHTGQHVLSRAFIEAGKLVTISFHLGDEMCTIDLDGPGLNDEIVDKAELLANLVIWEDRAVSVRTRAPAEIETEKLRKALPEGVTEVRLVEVEGFDTVGCCGTHVRRAGELGLIKVLKYEKTKGHFRAHFLSGKRAYRDLSKKHDILKRLGNRFTTSSDAIEEKLEKLQTEKDRLRKDSQKLAKRLAAYEADALHAAGERHGERVYVAEVVAGADEEYVRSLGSLLKAKKGTVSLLATEAGAVVCSASDDVAVDLCSIAVARAKSLGGGGGGKGGFATIRLPEGASPSDFIRGVLEEIKNA